MTFYLLLLVIVHHICILTQFLFLFIISIIFLETKNTQLDSDIDDYEDELIEEDCYGAGLDEDEEEDDDEDEDDENEEDEDELLASSSITTTTTTTTTTTSTTTPRPLDYYLSHFDSNHEHDSYKAVQKSLKKSHRDKVTKVNRDFFILFFETLLFYCIFAVIIFNYRL